MALESLGTETAKAVDNGFKLCHDLVLNEGFEKASEAFKLHVEGLYSIYPCKLDGRDAVEIRICVG